MDSHGRSSLGRFLSVKPEFGVLTSTARTFIQEGVTTQYATQVLGTTLDNGRLYAHLLTKSSRVLYDNDSPTRIVDNINNNDKRWNVNDKLAENSVVNYVKNTDYIVPNKVDTFVVFPTIKQDYYKFLEKDDIKLENDEKNSKFSESIEESNELLKSAPSNNPRVPYGQSNKDNPFYNIKQQNNVKVYQIYPQYQDTNSYENAINHKENDEIKLKVVEDGKIVPSKIRPLENIPTITVRNDFSPSGFAYFGDLPDFDISTESNKPTTVAERKAKLLFRAGKPNKHDFKTVTYTGFADFTTTVGDTIIVFSPQTSDVPAPTPVKLQPTKTLKLPPIGIATTIRTYLSQEPDMETHTVPGHKLDMHSVLATMVIDAANRTREPKNQQIDDVSNEAAKLAVLAKEQKMEFQTENYSQEPTTTEIEPTEETTEFEVEVTSSEESPSQFLRKPSPEDIANIIASLQAKSATEPLLKPTTTINELPTSSAEIQENTSSKVETGSKTIFYDDTAFGANIFGQFDIKEKPLTTINPPTTLEDTTLQSSPETTTTTETLPETTQNNPATTTTETEFTNEIFQDIPTTNAIQETTPEIISNEIETETSKNSQEEVDVECTNGKKILPTTAYQTLTYLTTFYIPDGYTTKLSLKSNVVVSPEVGYETRKCDEEIAATSVLNIPVESTAEQTTQQQEVTDISEDLDETTTEEPTTKFDTTTNVETTTPTEITTERRHVTESETETIEDTTETGEEVELLVKTLYTTYTYLTTYFQDSSSSIESRKVVITNVISSTIDPNNEASDPAIAGLLGKESTVQQTYKSKPITFEDFAEIAPSSVGIGRPTVTALDNSDEEQIDAPRTVSEATPALTNENLQQTINAVKTYYTTYTYFTTIFVDDQSEVSSRTEVYTNYVTPSIQPSVRLQEEASVINDDDTNEENEEDIRKKILKLNIAPSNSYSSTITRQRVGSESSEEVTSENIALSAPNKLSYSTLQRTTTTEQSDIDNNLLNLSEYETISTMVTDVRSSTSEGNKTLFTNHDKRNILDDQIVSESNNESEILASPTLLLQTSYTTFTYFTTLYQGTTSSNVVSRLETITNVVTETLSPTHTLTVDDMSLPVTYFTTFTYWTTLYKDGTTKTRSRKETVSNIVTPTAPSATEIIATAPIIETHTASIKPTTTKTVIEPTKTEDKDDELTTYYTTYTYRTTSYVGNSSVIKSRFETVTSVINKTDDVESNNVISTSTINVIDSSKVEEKPANSTALLPTGLLSTVVSTVENSGTKTLLSTEIFGTYVEGLYAKVLESTSIILTDPIEPTSSSSTVSSTENLKPTGVVSIHKGKIVDAESVSTLFYTTQAVGTYIDNQYAQVIESTSSLKVDEERKSALPSDYPVTHRTGLVRLIEGSIIQNMTTTLYQSRVLGTVIDGRYAQIIESTSSFIVDNIKPSAASSASNIAPTSSLGPSDKILPTDIVISPSPVVIESSLSDSTKTDEETTTESDEESDDPSESTRVKSRLTLKTKSRTFTPAIRPFVSRPRPTFAPKRKGPGPGATTITRTDFTPTVTATAASKTNRFGGRKSSSAAANIGPTASGSRRFSRPKASAAGGVSSGSANRNRSSGRIQPTAFGFGSSSRRGGIRSSSSVGIGNVRSSSALNNRFKIRPTATLGRFGNANTVTPPSNINDEDNDLTTVVTDESTGITAEDGETTLGTTESTSRRSQNPLLRFRRPPLPRPTTAKPTTKAGGRNGNVTGNKNNSRGKTTTARPKSLYRPVATLQGRQRPGNGLFPRRGLFTTTTPPPEDEEEDADEELLEEEGEEEDDDTEYEGTNTEIQTEQAPTQNRRSDRVQIRPFNFRRTKRQTSYSRFRRPTSRTTAAPVEEAPETEKPKHTRLSKQRTTPRPRGNAARKSPSQKRVAPTKASTQSRSQFTLREKDSSKPKSNFRRPSSSANRRTTTIASRPKAPRLRSSQVDTKPSRKSSQRTTNSNSNSNNRRRPSTRSRTSSEERFDNYVLPKFDGTITVTYAVPTEVSIPVVNGQRTEYKNVITAKYSTEVLGPQQYTSTVNAYGKEVTVLLSENTGIGQNGATQITHFILNETPTTSVIFTPTYIRGHKTSFSHVIPSTVYGVEEVVNTIQPALSPQAPLANILLSQLLLGQIGLPQQNPYIPGVAATPTTELVTKTTSYVTTVTSSTSTVLPLTFRGKEILTTIIDSSVTVVTATEFLTETITVTPTAGFPGGLNSLLVPLLLQQQQQQPQQPQLNQLLQPQQPANVFSFKQDQPFAQALFQEPKLTAPEEDNFYSEQSIAEEAEVVTQKPKRKNSRKKNKKPTPAPPVEPTKETSVVTLYVSGKVPGEFSTVLSTVFLEDNRRKREIQVEPSITKKEPIQSTVEYMDSFIMPATKDLLLQSSEQNPTESLESIIGDVSKHLVNDKITRQINAIPSKTSKKYLKSRSLLDTTGNFLVL